MSQEFRLREITDRLLADLRQAITDLKIDEDEIHVAAEFLNRLGQAGEFSDMLDIFFGSRRSSRCDGVSRRDFLRVGALTALGLSTSGSATRSLSWHDNFLDDSLAADQEVASRSRFHHLPPFVATTARAHEGAGSACFSSM